MKSGKGKPCGASYINASKVCRVSMAPEVQKALNAVAGEVGAATLKEAVKKHAGGKGVARLRAIRAEIRNEMGGVIVKGPKADELKKRLQAEGLLPNGKAKSVAEPDAGQIFAKQVRPKFTPLPTDIKQQLAALAGPTNRGLKKEYDKLDKEQNELQKHLDELQAMRISQAKPGEMINFLPNRNKAVPEQEAKSTPYRLIENEKQERIRHDKFRNFEKEDLKYYLDVEKDKAKPDKKKIAEYEAELRDREAKAGKSIVKEKDFRARRSAGWTDDDIEKDITAQYGDTKYDWGASRGSGSKVLGAGAFGSVMKEREGNAVKRGNIGYDEAVIMEKVGKADLGPKMLAADLDGVGLQPGTAKGRVAMTVVPGSPIGNKAGDKPIGKTGKVVADAYWEARAKLHRMGIAHNDMHIENVFIDRKGTGRFVDMGLAQDSPKAALAEAMGAFLPPKNAVANRVMGAAGQGDWQVRRWDGTAGRLLHTYESRLKDGLMPALTEKARKELEEKAPVLAKIQQNKADVQFAMKKDGFTNDDIASVMDHGIRSPLKTYNQGVWSRISDDQAKKYIDILYDGI
jgi:hypothetical protein